MPIDDTLPLLLGRLDNLDRQMQSIGTRIDDLSKLHIQRAEYEERHKELARQIAALDAGIDSLQEKIEMRREATVGYRLAIGLSLLSSVVMPIILHYWK